MKFSKSVFAKKYAFQHGRCYYCAVSLNIVKVEIDHFLPFKKYRNGKSENLVLACYDCNRQKTDMEITEFKEYFRQNFPHKLIRGLFYFEFLNLRNG